MEFHYYLNKRYDTRPDLLNLLIIANEKDLKPKRKGKGFDTF